MEVSSRLHAAVRGGNIQKVKKLLRKGINMDEVEDPFTMERPLHVAIALGFDEIVEILLEARASPSEPVWICDVDHKINPIHLAALQHVSPTTVIDKLLIAGANLNETTENGLNALHYAAIADNVNAIKYLVSRGLPVDKRSASDPTSGETPLSTAISHGNLAAVTALVNAGADVNALDSSGQSPLHSVMDGLTHQRYPEQSALSQAGVLLSAGANINWPSYSGQTPLRLLASYDDYDFNRAPYNSMVILLIAHGATDWQCVPTPCNNIGAALYKLWKERREFLPHLMRRFNESDKTVLRIMLRVLNRQFHANMSDMCLKILSLALSEYEQDSPLMELLLSD